MIPAEILTKFSGPPGTGKSTTLLNVVESLLSSGVDPEHIVYTTFTRAGAYEARDRACARFNLPAQRLPYFRTLHSLCYGLLPQTEVMKAADWNALGRELHLFFTRSGSVFEEGKLSFRTKGDVLMSLWSLARVRQVSLDEVWAQRAEFKGPEILRIEFDRFVEACNSYKQNFGRVDYTDMLEQWVDKGPDIHADYIIVDEAQDLSALQWRVVEKLCAHAKKVWIAGDDDQCIYEWSGADPKYFIELKAATYEVLNQSYRIPASVHRIANAIIAKVQQRLVKEYRPRAEEGEVHRVVSMDNISLKEGSWLLLGRSQYEVKKYMTLCLEQGVAFSGMMMGPEHKAILRAIDAIRSWVKLSGGQRISGPEGDVLYSYLGQQTQVKRGFKATLGGLPRGSTVSYEDLVKDHGLIAPKTVGWEMVFDLLDEEIHGYLRRVDQSGKFPDMERIRILTIHGSKGLEADNVVVMPELSQQALTSYLEKPDPEHRTFYVAVTRARQRLYLLEPRGVKAYPI